MIFQVSMISARMKIELMGIVVSGYRDVKCCNVNMSCIIGKHRSAAAATSMMMPWFHSKYVFTQPFHNEQDVTQGQFLSRVKLV